MFLVSDHIPIYQFYYPEGKLQSTSHFNGFRYGVRRIITNSKVVSQAFIQMNPPT